MRDIETELAKNPWPAESDTSPRAVLERALRGARLLARAAAESSPCERCDPGGEGCEIGSEVLPDVEAALELLPRIFPAN